MPKTLTYTTSSKLKLEQKNKKVSTIKQCDVFIDAPLWAGFKRADGMPNKKGVKASTQGLLNGLVSMIKYAHASGYWDSVEHLNYIIAYLEKGFAQPADVEKTEWEENTDT